MVRVLLFAHPRELLSAEFVDLPLAPGTYLAALREALASTYPLLEVSLPACQFAVDETLVPLEQEASTLAPELVALIPPVSGG
jgi:molybdopterin converting factor small subunit